LTVAMLGLSSIRREAVVTGLSVPA